MTRMAVLQGASNLEQVPITPPDRRHQLKGNRDEQFAVDIGRSYRLIFKPNDVSIPRKSDGGIDIKKMTAITVLEVTKHYQ